MIFENINMNIYMKIQIKIYDIQIYDISKVEKLMLAIALPSISSSSLSWLRVLEPWTVAGAVVVLW